jgi:hypothetical protein
MRVFFAFALIFGSLAGSQTPPRSETLRPLVLLEAVNIIHGVGHHTHTTLWARLRSDGSIEWETYANAERSAKHSTVIPHSVLATIKQRLDSINLSEMEEQSGPFATYVDPFVELKIDVASKTDHKMVTLVNPWGSTNLRKLGREKTMSPDLKKLFCTVDLIRNRVANDSLDSACANDSLPIE